MPDATSIYGVLSYHVKHPNRKRKGKLEVWMKVEKNEPATEADKGGDKR